jgi:hypothetical protein
MERYFILQSNGNTTISDKDRILHTMLNTDNDVQLWIQNYIEAYPNSDWNIFKNEFIDRFTPANESSEALNFLLHHIHVLSRADLKTAIDQYTALFLQKKALVRGVQEQVFSIAYVSHLPKSLQGHVESKVREWQANHPDQVAVGNGQPPLNDIQQYTYAAVPLCQSQWNTSERRQAVKKDSTYRSSNISAMVRDDNCISNVSNDTQQQPISSNAISSYRNNGNYGSRYNNSNNRFGNRGSNNVRQLKVPQWIINYCMQNKLCFRCKEPFTPETHPPRRRCTRPFKRLDPSLQPQSN